MKTKTKTKKKKTGLIKDEQFEFISKIGQEIIKVMRSLEAHRENDMGAFQQRARSSCNKYEITVLIKKIPIRPQHE